MSVSKRTFAQRMNLRKSWMLHLFLLPSVMLLLVYSYTPMFGIVIAFKNYKLSKGILKSAWVGLDQFQLMFQDDRILQIIGNTLIIAAAKMVAGWFTPLIFALLLNEVRIMVMRRMVQTLVYLPHFLSWVVLGGILTDMLSRDGLINQLIQLTGSPSIFFLGDGDWFRLTLVVSDVWKEFGFNTIIYMAALASVNPSLYEASEIDGANRWRQTINITIPSIMPVAIIIATLALGSILNAGFDQVFNMKNPLVNDKGEIIDTFVFEYGLRSGAYSFATAVDLFKSVVSFIMIGVTYRIASKYANYRIF